MSDYGKKKNDELATLCKERGLTHTGKKADLVKRLEEYDSTNATVDTSGEKIAKANEAEAISSDNTGAAATTASNGAEADSKAVDNETKEQPSTEDKAPAQDFSLGLEERTLDEEIEKRKKRAAKFGLDTKDDETLKQLERAKRFGTTNLPGLLNQALPERAERGKKRGREGKEDKEERKRSRQRPTQDSKAPAKSEENGAFPKWMTDADREKAEKRKAKFGTAT